MDNILQAVIFMFVTLFVIDLAFFVVTNITKIFRTSLSGGKAFKFFGKRL